VFAPLLSAAMFMLTPAHRVADRYEVTIRN
jgi:hypothetical protein